MLKVRRALGSSQWTLSMSFVCVQHAFVSVSKQGDDNVMYTSSNLIRFLAQERTTDPRKNLDYDYIQREIRARSKQSTVGKLLVTFQVLRLALQVIARDVHGLSTTPLEYLTCGYVLLSIGTYIAWWEKPYHMETVVRLKLSDGIVDEPQEKESNFCRILKPHVPKRKYFSRYATAAASLMTLHWPPSSIVLSQHTPISSFCNIHYAAWNTHFVTTPGQPIWRICSICHPFFPISMFALVHIIDDEINLQRLLMVLGICHIVVRLVLFGLVCMSFWALPADAYQDVSWLYIVPQWS